jgi:hypothetical protein
MISEKRSEKKMELFVLFGDIDNQLECLGVYESREAAVAAARTVGQVFGDHPDIQGYVIERRVMGATPKWGYMEDFRENLDLDAYSK